MNAAAGRERWLGSAAVLLTLAVALPPSALSRWIVASGGPADGGLSTGLWLTKLGLGLLAAGTFWAGRAADGTAAGGPGGAPSGTGGGEGHHRVRVLLAGIVLVALILRLVELGSGMWIDEIATLIDYVRHPLAAIVTTYDSDNNHVLYSVLARISVLGLGEGAVALRLPAVLLGVASVWAAYDFTRRVGSQGEAVLVSAFLAFSFHHVWFSQNARGYTGLLLFTILSSSAFLDMVREADPPRARRAALRYGLFAALGAWMHLTGLFVMAAHGLVGTALIVGRRFRGVRWLVAGLGASGFMSLIVYGPVLPQLVATLFGEAGVEPPSDWQGIPWLVAEMLRGLSRGLPGGWVALIGGGTVGVLGAVSVARRTPVALAVMILPAVIGMGVLLATGRNLWPRFFFFLAAFGVLIGFRGAIEAGQLLLGSERGTRVATAALTVAVLASGLLVPRAWGDKQDYESAVAYVDGVATAADATAVAGIARIPFDRYLGREWPVLDGVDQLQALEAGSSTVRVLLIFPTELEASAPPLYRYLREHYREEAAFVGTVGGGAVYVFRRDISAP